MNRLTTPLFMLASSGLLAMADEAKRAEPQDHAEPKTRSVDKSQFKSDMTKHMQDVKALSEEKKTELYRQLVKKIAAAKDPNDPFGNQEEWCLIGVILSQTKSEELMHEILLKTPPARVGFVSLEDFIKEVPARVLARVILDSAVLRSKVEP